MIFPLLLGFLLGAAAIVFALQNTAIVALTFLGWQFESSLALLILIALAAGVILSLLVAIPSAVRDSFRIMKQKKDITQLLKELDECRANQQQTVIVEQGIQDVPQVLDIRNQ